MSKAHSLISASSFKRTINCPGSFQLVQNLPASQRSSKTSSFAAEGTVAHYISETALEGKKDLADQLGQTITIDGHSITVDDEMVEMADTYVGFVQTLEALGYLVWIEQRVSPNFLWSPDPPPVDLFGTSDVIAYHPGLEHLTIVDLKYGRGIPVDVAWNPQLLYYAVGATYRLTELVNNFGGSHVTPAQKAKLDGEAKDGKLSITSIDTVIIQPRAPHKDGPVRRHTYSAQELVEWAENVLKPAVEAAVFDDAPPLVAGDHCKFCPAAATCPELVTTAQDKARAAFDDEDVEDADWSGLLSTASVLEDWISAVRAAAHARLEQGLPVPGYKLVPKRATRRWRNDDAVLDILVRTIPERDRFIDAGVKSPAQILSMKDVKNHPELLRLLLDQVTSISTGTTLAPDEDPRPAVPARGTAKDAFSDDALDTENNG